MRKKKEFENFVEKYFYQNVNLGALILLKLTVII